MNTEVCEVTCIVCPTGCKVRVVKEGTRVIEVSGNTCKRGEAYAAQEAVAPSRTLTTSIKVTGGDFTLVSVKSAAPVPKGRLFDLMKAVQKFQTTAPIQVGDVVVHDVLGLGVDLVATRAVHKTAQ
jgi:CxxC motif-containing protein